MYMLMFINNLTFNILFKHIVNDRVYVLIHILEKEREAIFNGQLQLLQEVRVVKCAHLKLQNKYNMNIQQLRSCFIN